MDVGVVVSAQLLLLLLGPGPQRNPDVDVGVLAADHEADLTRGVGRDGGVSVLGNGEDLLAVLLELGDERQVQPLVLSCLKSVSLEAQFLGVSQERGSSRGVALEKEVAEGV